MSSATSFEVLFLPVGFSNQYLLLKVSISFRAGFFYHFLTLHEFPSCTHTPFFKVKFIFIVIYFPDFGIVFIHGQIKRQKWVINNVHQSSTVSQQVVIHPCTFFKRSLFLMQARYCDKLSKFVMQMLILKPINFNFRRKKF